MLLWHIGSDNPNLAPTARSRRTRSFTLPICIVSDTGSRRPDGGRETAAVVHFFHSDDKLLAVLRPASLLRDM